MKSGILILVSVTLATIASSVLALPGRDLNGNHKLDILKLHQQAGVHPQGFDELLEGYQNSIEDCFYVIIDGQSEVDKLLANYAQVLEQARDIFIFANDKMGTFVRETLNSLNPDDPLEDTALLIDVTVVRSTLLLVKAAKDVEDVVAKNVAELLPSVKSINKRVAGDVEKKLEPLIALTNKCADDDWFRLELSKEGTRWFGKCWHAHNIMLQYEFDIEFDIPITYPVTSPEIALPELDGKTAKVYRGGKICLSDHFKPLCAKNVPKFDIGHAMVLG